MSNRVAKSRRVLSIIGPIVTVLPLATLAQGPARGPLTFAAYDTDGDGYISLAEFTAVREQRMADRMAAGLPAQGMANAPEFGDFDSDGDGRLSEEELLEGQQARMASRPGIGTGPGGGAGGAASASRMPDFQDFDLDGDGQLQETEFNEARNARITERAREGFPMRNLGNAPAFADLDADGNGVVTPDEFARHQAQHRRSRMR